MARQDSSWRYDEDRCYHGIQHGTAAAEARVLVELSEFGWTERAHPRLLRELGPNWLQATFNWGYVGTGTNATAKAILEDALGFEPAKQMFLDFGEDVLAQFPEEFRLRRGAVLRWARGWAAQYGIQELPSVLAALPPVDRTDYQRRPTDRAPRG